MYFDECSDCEFYFSGFGCSLVDDDFLLFCPFFDSLSSDFDSFFESLPFFE